MSFILVLLKLLPTIISVVMALETEISAQGAGATKKQIILDVIEIAIKNGEQVDNKTVQAIAQIVDNVVATLNKAGLLGAKK